MGNKGKENVIFVDSFDTYRVQTIRNVSVQQSVISFQQKQAESSVGKQFFCGCIVYGP